MAESCNINCTASPPPYTPDSDISGVGVVINYVVTAGLAIFLIIVYYTTVYDPSIDPFDTARKGALSDRVNPLDDFLLRWLRSKQAYISKKLLHSRQLLSLRARYKLERVLIECLLLMSDLQIVTGFAILLSGFAQWQCGLAALKWRIIIDLAWFSCLTHLSCLTMLRHHLHTHTFQRVWRLFAMGVLAALLVAGLLITANHKWLLLSEDTKSTPTICIVGCSLHPGPDKEWVNSMVPSPKTRVKLWHPVEWFWTPVISASFVLVSFVTRVVRLHKRLSVGASRAAKWFDGHTERLLWAVFRVFCKGDVYSLKRSLGYRPIFGIVMVLRFVLVSWASLAVEVSWVIAAFTWGVYRLVRDLSPDSSTEPLDMSKQAWTFGQVVSVLTLAAPLISIFGTLEGNSKGEESLVTQQTSDSDQSYQLPFSCISSSTSEDPERPDTNWAVHSSCLGAATTYVYTCFIFVGAGVISSSSMGSAPLTTIYSAGTAIPMGIYSLYCLVLCSLIIELAISQDRRWLRRLLQLLVTGLFVIGWIVTGIPQYAKILAGIGIYVTGALIHRTVGWRTR